MLKAEEFTELLKNHSLTNVVGVPDSTFKEWIDYVAADNAMNHTTAANECEAVAIAVGQYLATGLPSVVYMQNDGLGKTVNPHTSLCARDVYSIPMLLMIGWRGEPGSGDAPQHAMMGRVLQRLLDLLNIRYEVLSPDAQTDRSILQKAVDYMAAESMPFALLIRRGLFASGVVREERDHEKGLLLREQVIGLILDSFDADCIFVSTTGKASRELFELRKKRGDAPGTDFYTVGAMGCAPAIALGIAQSCRSRNVCVIDGDGAILMQMGSLATIGHYGMTNFKHIIIDNRAHDSTGGQPTVSSTTHFVSIARACGYPFTKSVESGAEGEIVGALKDLAACEGPGLLVVRAQCGSRKDLGRPTTPLIELKKGLMSRLQGEK